MQQIIYKFQGKAKEDGRLVQGDLLHEPNDTIIRHTCNNGERENIPVIPESVGQFTGFKDSKRTEEYPDGQEIYVGDMVSARAYCGLIHGRISFGSYETIHYGFYIDWQDASSGTRQDIWFWAPKLEVIREENS